jgi:carboxymethylenebutenolidase
MFNKELALALLLAVPAAGLAQQIGPPLPGTPDEEARPAPEGFRLAPVVITDLLDVPMGTGAAEPSSILQTRQRFTSGRDKVLVDILRPRAPGRYPAVILLHGAHPTRGTQYYYDMAEDLARKGYVCLFVRYYDRGRKGRGSRADWTRTVGDALTFATTLPDVNSSRMALLGYSLGAFLSLTYAPTDPRVQAVVAFYGGVSPGDMPKAMEHLPPTLLLHGTYDRTVPVRRSIDAFEQLRLKAKPVDVVIYPKVGHGFTLHTRGGWDEIAGEDSWDRTISFLNFHLKYPAWTPEVPLPDLQGPGDSVSPYPRRDLFPGQPALKMPYLEQIDREGASAVLVNPSPEEAKALTTKIPPSSRSRSHKKAAPKVKGKAPAAKPAIPKKP